MSRGRISYPQSMRDQARAENKGLVTIHIVEPDGRSQRLQGPANDDQRSAAYELFNRIWSGQEAEQ